LQRRYGASIGMIDRQVGPMAEASETIIRTVKPYLRFRS
jgi:hypothetical protein